MQPGKKFVKGLEFKSINYNCVLRWPAKYERTVSQNGLKLKDHNEDIIYYFKSSPINYITTGVAQGDPCKWISQNQFSINVPIVFHALFRAHDF